MGIVNLGAPTDLVSYLGQQFSVRAFVETGTYLGSTSVWAASHFDRVVTIENAPTIYEQTLAKYGHISNIEFLFGNSKDVLKVVVPTLQAPAIFWLDGHWSGGDTYGEFEQCPLLEEIEIITALPIDHFLLVDDARLFTSPPPHPMRIEEWPTIDQVIKCIERGAHEKYIAIFEDVIIAVPKSAQHQVAQWLQEANTRTLNEWQKQSTQKQVGRLRQAIGLVGQAMLLLGQSAFARMRTEKR